MKKRIILSLSLVVLTTIALVIACDCLVTHSAKGQMYNDVSQVPHRKVGVVLGTSPISVWTGRRNYYFDNRISTASQLYMRGKVDWLIVSGGDYREAEGGYDEPVAMRDSLVKQGVNVARIILDYDGTRTLSTIAKLRDVYQLDSVILVSQQYHNERALYQAKHLGINAIAVNAKTPKHTTSWIRNRGREIVARLKLFIDVVINDQPEYKDTCAVDFTRLANNLIQTDTISTEYGELLRLIPDMERTKMNMLCGQIPDPQNDSILLAFAGAFTGELLNEFRHSNIAGDHVFSGVRYKGYRCKRNTGAFSWSLEAGAQFHYQDYSSDLDWAATYDGMAFAQEMMIHEGETVPTMRPLNDRNVFRAICRRSDEQLAIYETRDTTTFGKFIQALLADNVAEALYTDMGSGWNYAFYRHSPDSPPTFLHDKPTRYATNFVVISCR